MADQELPATVEPASGPALERPSEEPSQAPLPEISPAIEATAAAGIDAAYAEIRAQPKVKIRIPKVFGPQQVGINGAFFNVPSGVWVEVPEQVAEILAEAGRR